MPVTVCHQCSILLLFLLFSSFSSSSSLVEGKIDSFQANSDQLCPSLCSCTEQKPKSSTKIDEKPVSTEKQNANSTSTLLGSNSKEILKFGIKVQCQNTPSIASIKNLSLSNLLIENTFQLDLSGNRLSTITSDDFSTGNYSMLQRLILKNNRIEDIAADSFVNLKNLKYLDLSNNLLQTFSKNIIAGLTNLERVKFNGNPVYCDCRLSETLTYLSSRRIKLLGTCSQPPRFKDQTLSRLAVEDLPCEWRTTIDIKPTTNQIVFEGDPLKLSCKLKTKNPSVILIWLQHNGEETISVSASPTVDITTAVHDDDDAPEDGGTAIESSLQIRNLLPENGGRWTCASVDKLNSNLGAKFQNVSKESRYDQDCITMESNNNAINHLNGFQGSAGDGVVAEHTDLLQRSDSVEQGPLHLAPYNGQRQNHTNVPVQSSHAGISSHYYYYYYYS